MARVLVVDDEKDLLELVGLVLKRGGHEVLTARTLAEASLQIAPAPDAALVDLSLPDGDATSLCSRLVAEGTAVLLFSARRRETVQGLVDRLGAAGSVSKPFEPSVLLDAVRAALRGRPGAAAS